MPIIGQISLARDMKAALQEAEDAEEEAAGREGGGRKVIRDAKGREIISEEEKAKKDEKARKVAAEVSLSSSYVSSGLLLTVLESGSSCGARAEARGQSRAQAGDIHGIRDGP